MATRGSGERVLVTGAWGCIGVWTVAELLARGHVPVAFDLSPSLPPRVRVVLGDGADDPRIVRVAGDVTDLAAVERVLDEEGIGRVIHLAALQVPFCRADPPRGAAVNVVGTANVLEAARRRRERIPHVVYASSIAAYDAFVPGAEPAMVGVPSTIYGVYKRANEQMARRYHEDEGVASVGLRPHTVVGPGRDQGVTSSPTVAILAAAAGVPYAIPYGGAAQLQYAPDVARAFVQAAFADVEGAGVWNLAGTVRSVDQIVDAIVAAVPDAAGRVTGGGAPLPFPDAVDPAGLAEAIGPVAETPFADAVADAVARFRAALAAGAIAPPA